ncbi:hypothetical protein X734_18180 [Mesorhizobium sp. L2C084A000]|nr:hypothetical protein X734_18180 [Mesorhizobium sp. L2C084A000]
MANLDELAHRTDARLPPHKRWLDEKPAAAKLSGSGMMIR